MFVGSDKTTEVKSLSKIITKPVGNGALYMDDGTGERSFITVSPAEKA